MTGSTTICSVPSRACDSSHFQRTLPEEADDGTGCGRREAGDTVTLQFNAEGINDGPFGTFPPTGKRVSFPVINVIKVNGKGEIERLEQLHDRLEILTQLGHVPAG